LTNNKDWTKNAKKRTSSEEIANTCRQWEFYWEKETITDGGGCMYAEISELLKNIPVQALAMGVVRIVFILVLAWIISVILKKMLNKMKVHLLEKSRFAGELTEESSRRAETLTHLIRQALMIALGIIVALTVLKEVGFEIGPILASAGIV
jgi:small conductance mechanosensitive channel